MGDPAGIGGELTLRAWQALHRSGPCFVALDDPQRLAALSTEVPIVEIAAPEAARTVFADALPVLPIKLAAAPHAGHPNKANAKAVITSIKRAAALCLNGTVGGMVTNPINKAALYDAGFAYPGHTEFLAALTNASGKQIMMLASPDLRVVPVTVHASLRNSIAMLTTEAIVAAAQTTATALQRDFAIDRPRLAIAGLNPHAGEQGALGDEETTLIGPAIAALRAEGIDVSGPWPPDTMFTATARSRYDAAICMYHDQALIPLKTLDMDRGVNVTLGLPIVRTSPDHGTAYDIAGKNIANPASLIAAIQLAATLATRRHA
jgi:4-hydroxythreonine-4-phosphate dehydrogenase